MTASAQSLLALAQAEVGYVEGGGPDGRSGNQTKYWQDLAPNMQGQPWCAAFQRWVNLKAGAPDLPVSNPYYCPTLVTYAKQHGLWSESGQYAPGDLVFFDFSGSGMAEHIGRVVSDDGTTVVTIEGNTSSGNTGDQANGGGTYRRQRPHGSTLLGVLQYSTLLSGGAAPCNPVKSNPYAPSAAPCQQGATGDAVRFVQWAVGCPVDGSFGPQTTTAVRGFQQSHGLTVDGLVGPASLSALRGVTH